MNKKQILKELWDNCGEYLEHIPQDQWRHYVTPILIRQLAKARDEIEYLKKRLEHATRDTGMVGLSQEANRSK